MSRREEGDALAFDKRRTKSMLSPRGTRGRQLVLGGPAAPELDANKKPWWETCYRRVLYEPCFTSYEYYTLVTDDGSPLSKLVSPSS